jgi:hypothetical protein
VDPNAQSLEKDGIRGYLRRHPQIPRSITLQDLQRECRVYEAQEPRDSMYRVSRFLVQEWWGDTAKLADALSVLLLTWNANFYRFGGGLRPTRLKAAFMIAGVPSRPFVRGSCAVSTAVITQNCSRFSRLYQRLFDSRPMTAKAQ